MYRSYTSRMKRRRLPPTAPTRSARWAGGGSKCAATPVSR